MRRQDEEERRQAQINIEQFKSFIARRRWKVHMHCESRTIRTITTKYSDSDGNIKSKRRAELSGKSATYEGEYSETDSEGEDSSKNKLKDNKSGSRAGNFPIELDNNKDNSDWRFGRQKLYIPNIELKPVKMFEYNESIDDDDDDDKNKDNNNNKQDGAKGISFNNSDMHDRISENLSSKLNLRNKNKIEDDNDPNLVSKETKQYQRSDSKSFEKIDEKTGTSIKACIKNEYNTNEDIKVHKINQEEQIQGSDDCIVKKITTKTLTTKKITKTTTTTTKKGLK